MIILKGQYDHVTFFSLTIYWPLISLQDLIWHMTFFFFLICWSSLCLLTHLSHYSFVFKALIMLLSLLLLYSSRAISYLALKSQFRCSFLREALPALPKLSLSDKVPTKDRAPLYWRILFLHQTVKRPFQNLLLFFIPGFRKNFLSPDKADICYV